MAKKVKKAIRKLRYLDKTKSSYFIVTTFIAAFFLFTGVTYSYFIVTNNMGNATITIAKLNYTLSSTTSGYNNGSIVVPAEETVFLDLDLRSENVSNTKYALNYNASNTVNVYYSENLKKNMSGIIGPAGSIINMRVVIENTSSFDETVSFTVKGGYLQNILTSNITQGYFEQDEVIRYVVYDEDFENSTVKYTMPYQYQYVFYKAECSNDVTATFDEENWTITTDRGDKKTSCDIYFKKPKSDATEKYYHITASNGLSTYTTTKPDTSGLYRYISSSCSDGVTFTFNESTNEFNINNPGYKHLCVAEFTMNEELESSDKIIVTFDSNGGSGSSTKELHIGGTYGSSPEPTKEGYGIEGWYTQPVGGEKVLLSTVINEQSPTVLYAHWIELIPVNVTLDFSYVGYPSINITLYYGLPYGDLPIMGPVMRSFRGWYFEPSSSGEQVTADTIVTKLEDHVLYARWYEICFAADTLVYTPNGYRKIQDIKSGEEVYSYNENTKEVEISKVQETMVNQYFELTVVTLEDGTTINVTGYHPFYNPQTKTWMKIKDFKVGDYVMNNNGESIKIVSKRVETKDITVYNFDVEKNHNYFVTEDNILVHNYVID